MRELIALAVLTSMFNGGNVGNANISLNPVQMVSTILGIGPSPLTYFDYRRPDELVPHNFDR